MSTTQSQSQPRIAELTRDYKFAAFTTMGEHGIPNTRPMATQEAEPDMDLWFATWLDSEKVDELRRNPKVGVYYYDAEKNIGRYVSIGGTVEIIKDQARFKRYWKDSWRQWFPKGPDDPDAVLLKVDAEVVTYEDGHDAPVTFHPSK